MYDDKKEQLKKKLEEQLPIDKIDVEVEADGSTGHARFYDYYGVTYCEDRDERQFVYQWLVEVISQKAGFPIRIVRERDGNGHCEISFTRADPNPT